MRTCLIYSRVSTAAQSDEGTSLDSQVEACHSFAIAQGYEVKETVCEVFSGADLFERPLLNEQREKIRQGAYDAIVIYAIDRLSRNIAHLAIISDELERFNTKLLCVTENLDDTPEGKLMLSVKSYVAEVEREKIRERCVRGKKTKIAQGKFVPAADLYGYRFNRETGKREIFEPEAGVVREIFGKVSTGASLRSLVLLLNDNHTPPPSAGKRTYKDGRVAMWQLSALRRIVREPAYYGKTYAWRFKRTTEFKRGKKVSKIGLRERNEWVELNGITPPILPESVWQAAQQKLSDNHGERKRNEQTPYLLRGMVFCGECGKKMYADAEHRTTTRIYRCSSRRHHRCTGKRINAEKTENFIWQVIKKALENPRSIEIGLDKYYRKGKRKKLESHLETARQSLSKIEAEIKTLVNRAATADNSVWTLFEEQIKSRQMVQARLKAQIAELEINTNGAASHKTGILDRVAAFQSKTESADFETKRLILESFNVKVYGNGKNIDLYTDWIL